MAEQSWNTVYPRPQLRRDSFLPLNDGWTLNGLSVNVPWPPQAKRSGYEGQVGEHLCYENICSIPSDFAGTGQRIFLHFGAVDQCCTLSVNGQRAGTHEGGYLPFSFDITDLLTGEENALRLEVDDTLSRDYPYGKQHKRPHEMWYTPVSGIWQTVWLEAVPDTGGIRSLRITPDLTGITLAVETDAPEWSVTVSDLLTRTSREKTLRLELPDPHLWTPDDPYLYDLTVTTNTDRVESYFALRTVTMREMDGHTRLCLNGEPIFLHGVLDQGYFTDGLYLPHEPGEYERDILRMKELGFNLLRKHIKVEPEEFYYQCDRLGMLVLQDMVNSGGYSWLFDTVIPTFVSKWRPDSLPFARRGARHRFFEQHTRDTQRQLYNHPSIVGYTIFNEGWGQYDSDRIYERCKREDPTRFYDSTSGWFAQKKSDTQSEHIYFRNEVLHAKRPGQFLFLSECGGYTRGVEGHLPENRKNYGYGKSNTEEELTAMVEKLYREMVLPSIPEGLCGCVYTQLSDVEGEINGLYTYDRQVCKVDRAAMRRIAEQIAAAAPYETEVSVSTDKPMCKLKSIIDQH